MNRAFPFAVLILSCASPDYSGLGIVYERAPDTFACSPAKVERGGLVTLTMAVPHWPFLNVRDPDRTTFPLVFEPMESYVGKSLVPIEQFPSIATLVFSTSSLQQVPFVAGSQAAVPVFSAAGTYSFLLTQEFASDLAAAYRCEVLLQ